MPATIERFLDDQSGSSAVEYGLVVALVSLLIMATLMQVSESVRTLFFGLAELIVEATNA